MSSVLRTRRSIHRFWIPGRRGGWPLRLVLIGFALAAPGAARAQRVLNVSAHDTALEVSTTVPAGVTTVHLVLRGTERRELMVHRIPTGTLPETFARGARGRPERLFEKWSYGGPAVPRDSATDASVTIDLRPGRYALLSYEVDRAGRPTGEGFLWAQVTAIAAAALIPGRFPVADATVRVRDKRINVDGHLRPGQRTIQVENAGIAPHEVVIGRLRAGKTLDDVRRWNGTEGPAAPFVYVGGITPMSSGMTAQAKLVLQSGEHVVFCRMHHQDGADYAHGVLTSFTVN